MCGIVVDRRRRGQGPEIPGSTRLESGPETAGRNWTTYSARIFGGTLNSPSQSVRMHRNRMTEPGLVFLEIDLVGAIGMDSRWKLRLRPKKTMQNKPRIPSQ